jgi:hypothetical protein
MTPSHVTRSMIPRLGRPPHGPSELTACSWILQCAFTEHFGIVLTRYGKINDPLGHDPVGEIVSVRQSKGCSSHLEGDAHHADGLGIEPVAV